MEPDGYAASLIPLTATGLFEKGDERSAAAGRRKQTRNHCSPEGTEWFRAICCHAYERKPRWRSLSYIVCQRRKNMWHQYVRSSP